MAQEQNRKTRRTLEATRHKYIESTGCEISEDGVALVEFDAFDQVWTYPHPLFAPDEWTEAVDDAPDNESKAAAILGEKQYARFVEAGGGANDVMIMFIDTNASLQAEIVAGGKKRPTRR